jgi:hypothetical protein
MKVCTKCNIEKELLEFNNQKLGKQGKRSYCKLCQSIMKKEYVVINKEKLYEYQINYRIKNPNYNSDYQKKRRSEDINYRLIGNLRARITNIIKNKTKNTLNCLGLPVNEFKLYIESLFVEGMNWDNYGKWHIDHIIPLSSVKIEEEIYQLCHYTNLQPLWADDNLKKSNKILIKKEII